MGSQTVIVTHAAHKTGDTAKPYRILTDSTSKDADRLYIYKTAVK